MGPQGSFEGGGDVLYLGGGDGWLNQYLNLLKLSKCTIKMSAFNCT